jgi:vacuolar-type H+-ATPase subunit E/Vma4
MEPEVFIRCRKSDLELVRSIIEPAMTEYKAIMKAQVKIFKNRDVPCKVEVDLTKHLPEYDENEANESCLGGILMHCRKGRIVCSNTLDERLALCY